MATTDIVGYACASTANVLTQGAYLTTGYALGMASGIVPSNYFNKAIRQASFMAAGLAQFCVNQSVNIPDDGIVANLATFIQTAIQNAAPPFLTKNIQVVTASTSYVPHANLIGCDVRVIGGGAAGGGATTASGAAGGGGGSGGETNYYFTAAQISAFQSCTIGIAGAGVSGVGGNGGTTIFGALCSATGGIGGNFANSASGSQAGGGPGTGTIQGLLVTHGNAGQYSNSTSTLSAASGGQGGASSLGGQGQSATGGAANGNAASSNTGAGGGGGVSGGSPQTGGNGGSGVIIITEYIS